MFFLSIYSSFLLISLVFSSNRLFISRSALLFDYSRALSLLSSYNIFVSFCLIFSPIAVIYEFSLYIWYIRSMPKLYDMMWAFSFLGGPLLSKVKLKGSDRKVESWQLCCDWCLLAYRFLTLMPTCWGYCFLFILLLKLLLPIGRDQYVIACSETGFVHRPLELELRFAVLDPPSVLSSARPIPFLQEQPQHSMLQSPSTLT